jgi:low affinity Fe/Cu permease
VFHLAAKLTGHPWHFWGKAAGAVLVFAIGWLMDQLEFVMLLWTTLLTITTDLQTIVIQHSGDEDTASIKAELSELGRAVPGARDVIRE